MLRIIFIDMCNRFLNRRNHFDRKYIVQIFFSPVLLCCMYSSRNQFISSLICADLYMFLLKTFRENRKKGIFHILMYKNRFAGIADTYSLSLGIHDNICRHLQISGFIHIYMTVTCTCLNNRNRTLFYHSFDQSSAAPWDKYIHILIHFHKFCCCFSGCIGNQLDCILLHIIFFQSFSDAVYNRFIGMDRITSAFQDNHITGLKAQSKCICGYVWSCFINNPNNAKRYSFLSDQQSVWTLLHPQYLSDRIIQSRYLT